MLNKSALIDRATNSNKGVFENPRDVDLVALDRIVEFDVELSGLVFLSADLMFASW